MIRTILSIGLLFYSLGVEAQEGVFSQLPYDEVIAYEFNGMGNVRIDQAMNTERLNQSLVLNSKQIKELETLLCSPGHYGRDIAACFDPHFAVVYYNKEEILAQIDICLSCNFLESSISIPAETQVLIDEGTPYERTARGFSPTMRKMLDAYITSLGFEKYPLMEGSIFDE